MKVDIYMLKAVYVLSSFLL